jgi:hypothetical protein
LAAQDAGADYVAFGSFFSPTKPHAVRADVGLLRQGRRSFVFDVAIGDYPGERGRAAGSDADALAVIHGIFGQPDPKSAAATYAELFRSHGECGSSHSTSAQSMLSVFNNTRLDPVKTVILDAGKAPKRSNSR